MPVKPTINKPYLLITILLFVTELLIALYLHDGIIRPYIGDFLVVILIYSFVKAFFNLPILATGIGVLLFSYIIEILQYFHIVKRLGLQHCTIAKIIIGTS